MNKCIGFRKYNFVDAKIESVILNILKNPIVSKLLFHYFKPRTIMDRSWYKLRKITFPPFRYKLKISYITQILKRGSGPGDYRILKDVFQKKMDFWAITWSEEVQNIFLQRFEIFWKNSKNNFQKFFFIINFHGNLKVFVFVKNSTFRRAQTAKKRTWSEKSICSKFENSIPQSKHTKRHHAGTLRIPPPPSNGFWPLRRTGVS